MSSSSSQDLRFVEVLQISIREIGRGQSKATYRVVIKHDHGSDEIPSDGKCPIAIMKCRVFVNLDNEETRLIIHRVKRLSSNATPVEARLKISGDSILECKVELDSKHHMELAVTLGKQMTVTEVADARYDQATEALDRMAKRMEAFAAATSYLKFMMKIGEAAADVNPIAKFGFAVADQALDKIAEVPELYVTLKNVARDCISYIKFDEDARKVFKTERVRTILNTVMELTIKTLEFISVYYSKGFIKRHSSSSEGVKDLIWELEKQKEQITHAFLVEIREFQTGQAQAFDQSEQETKLRQLISTNNSVHHGKAACFPGTRVSILETLASWSRDKSLWTARLFWLHGVAGCGKSAVAASISQILAKTKQLAGTFFCKRDEEDRRNPIRLAGHIAYYLARTNAAFRSALLESLDDPDFFVSKDLETYVDFVLKKPLSKSKGDTLATPVTFLIDALDECNESGAVAVYLAQIAADASWVRIIVTSRDQPYIRRAFSTTSMQHDLFAENAREDLRKYFRKMVDREDLRYLLAHEEAFIIRSDGLFILMHTVLALIIMSEWGRDKLVDEILNQPMSKSVVDQMTSTYMTVLNCATASTDTSGKVKEIVRVIIGILVQTSKTGPLTISGLYAFIPPSLRKGSTLREFVNIVMKLSPVLRFTPVIDESSSTSPPQFDDPAADPDRFLVQAYHASFLDFSEQESVQYTRVENNQVVGKNEHNEYWEDPVPLNGSMAMGCLEIMTGGMHLTEDKGEAHSGLRFNICGLDIAHRPNKEYKDLPQRIAKYISSELLYSSLYWMKHVEKYLANFISRKNEVGILDVTKLSDKLSDFLGTDLLLFWLEVLSLTNNLSTAREILSGIMGQSKSSMFGRFSEIASDARIFVEQCSPAISTSTPHLYVSLAWIASDSKLWTIWKKERWNVHFLNAHVHSSRLLLSFTCPRGVGVFAVSPDGKHIVSGSKDGYVRLWDLVSGDLLRSARPAMLEGDEKGKGKEVDEALVASNDAMAIDALSYTPDGSGILCVRGNVLDELNFETLVVIGAGTPLRHVGIRCIAISKDSARLALGLRDGSVVILDAKSHSIVQQLRGHSKTVNMIAWSTDDSHLTSASDDYTVCIWDPYSGQLVGTPLKGHTDPVCTVAFSPDDETIVSGAWDRRVKMWSSKTGEAIGESWDTGYPVTFVGFLSDSSRIVVAVATKEDWRRFGPDEPVELPLASVARCHHVGCWPDGAPGYVWAEQVNVQVWDAEIMARQEAFATGHSDFVTSVAISADGERIVSGAVDRTVRVWDAHTGKPVAILTMQHSSRVRFVTFSPDGLFIASGGDDKAIHIWDARTGAPVRIFEGHSDTVMCGSYSTDGTKFISGSFDKTLCLWETRDDHPNGKPMMGHEEHVISVAFSPDGTRIASASKDSTIRIWDGRTGESLGNPLIGHEGDVFSVAFSRDGSRIASGGMDCTIRLWDLKTRSKVGEPLKGHTSAVGCVVFSSDGSLIYSSSRDKTIRCWDALSGKPVGEPLIGHTDNVVSLAVFPDNRHIVSASTDKAICLWDAKAFLWDVDKSIVASGVRGPDRIPISIPDDGWIRRPDGGLLLWVPPDYRNAVCDMCRYCISRDENDTPIRIMWDMLNFGNGFGWTTVRGLPLS